MKRAELLREHARTMLNIAESTRGEDRACLQSVARGWFRAADKLERVDQQERSDRAHETRQRRITMHRTKRLSTKSVTVAGIAASLMLAFAGVTFSPAPARAVVYCQYVGYPHGCVARAGVVLRPRPVARAAVRHNAGGNLNGGVNRVGVRR
jgi:hypothetical protein